MTAAAPLQAISSMATRQILAELNHLWQNGGGVPLHIQSVGGVDAARRVLAGDEAFDLVFLAADALAKLDAAGRLVAGSITPLARSGVSVAVPEGAAVPDISSEAALREAVLAAPSIGYSTGPSGQALLALFERWGIAERVRARCVQAATGTPVGTLVASGQVALGFQQTSELIHVRGITLLGAMPAAVAIDTVFSGAVVTGSPRAALAARVLHFMASPAATAAKIREGMSAV